MLTLFMKVLRRSNRVRVGVLDDGGYAAGRRSPGPEREVLPIGIPGIHQMYVGVDHSRHDQLSRGIDDFTASVDLTNVGDASLLDENVSAALAGSRDQGATLDRHGRHAGPSSCLMPGNIGSQTRKGHPNE